jgi:hypothetical protein
MKRLITIFLLSFVAVSLWGQEKLPVAILGDVYIDDSGIMDSEGPVHLKAPSQQNIAKVANYGILNMKDSVIFYSNDSIDGLLMNKGSSVTGNAVAVRKSFNYGWFQVSFPFNVDLTNGVLNGLDGTKLTLNTDFYVEYYDAQKRADRGINDVDNWVEYTGTTLTKGVAYRIAVDDQLAKPGGPSFDVDFVSTLQDDIAYLFSKDSKGITLTYAESPSIFPGSAEKIFINPENSEGWNAFGGLNSTNFAFNSTSYTYPHTVYFWDISKNNGAGAWNEIEFENASGTLRPYAVIFVQTDPNTVLNYNTGTQTGGFVFNGGDQTGVTLESNAPLFRSLQTSSDDVIRLQLASGKNTSLSSPIYFRFGPTYSKFFKKTNDDFRLETQSKFDPIVWSVSKSEDNDAKYILYLNSLPNGENEVPLGVNIPSTDEYVFSLKEYTNETVKSVILLDKVTGMETELLANDYHFHSNGAINTEDRFVLYFNRTTTSIDAVETSDIYAYAENNTLTVKNLLTGDKVQVMDMTGRTIASGVANSNSFSTPLNQKGVYIVNVRGTKTLKVLNK